MEEVKHTPGPWIINDLTVYALNKYGRNSFSAQVVMGYLSNDDELYANARLIAAAPELLEALQDYVDFRSNVKDVPGSILEKARAAIVKATGVKS